MTATCNDAVRQRAILRNGCWIGTRSSHEIVRCVSSNAGTFHRGIRFTHRTQFTRRPLYVGGAYALIQFYWENSSCPFSCGTFRWLSSSGHGMSLYHPARKEVWKRTSMPSQHVKRRNYRPSEILQVEAAAARACCKPARDGWRRCATALRFRRCK